LAVAARGSHPRTPSIAERLHRRRRAFESLAQARHRFIPRFTFQESTVKKSVLSLLVLCAISAPVAAQVKVADPWVRATVPQQKATGAFMNLTAEKGTRLVEARSPVAGVVEIHEMTMENNVMKMRAIAGLDLPAGKAVELKPGGYHVMLMDLKEQMKEGQSVPLTLVVEDKDKKRQAIEVKAIVRPLTSDGRKHGHGH
jgi:copper(I)-binding protein